MQRAPRPFSRKSDATDASRDDPSPAYKAKGSTLNLVLLSKSAQAPAPAYNEKPGSHVDLAVCIKDVKTAPKEIFKDKKAPLPTESVVVAKPTEAELSHPAPKLEESAPKLSSSPLPEVVCTKNLVCTCDGEFSSATDSSEANQQMRPAKSEEDWEAAYEEYVRVAVVQAREYWQWHSTHDEAWMCC